MYGLSSYCIFMINPRHFMSNVGIPGSTASHVVPFFGAANVKLRLHGLTLPRVDGSMLCSMAMVEATKIPMSLKSRKVVYISLKTELGVFQESWMMFPLLKAFTPTISEGKISSKSNVALKKVTFMSCLYSGFR